MSTADLPDPDTSDSQSTALSSKASALVPPQIEFSLAGIIGASLGLVLFLFVSLELLSQGFNSYYRRDFMNDAPTFLVVGALAFVSIVLLEVGKRSVHARSTKKITLIGLVAVWMTLMTMVLFTICAVMNFSNGRSSIVGL